MKGLMILSHYVEDVEALASLALLKRAGLEIDTATCEDTLDLVTAYGLNIKAQKQVKEIILEDYQFLVIPGGPYVAKVIDKDQSISLLAQKFNQQGKLVASICAGPRFLGRIGLLDHKRFTAYPGSEKDMALGIYCPLEKVVTDGIIVTSRGAGVVYDFVFEIVRMLLGEDNVTQLKNSIRY